MIGFEVIGGLLSNMEPPELQVIVSMITIFPIQPGVGVTKVPFVNFSVSKIFDLAKVPVTFFKSHSYLTDVKYERVIQ